MIGGLVPLNKEVISTFVEKHPEPASVTEDSILEGPLLKIHLTAYEEIDSLQLYRLHGV